MVDTIGSLLSFPPENVAKLSPKEYDNRISDYMSKLAKLPRSTWTKEIEKKNILDLLDPSVNTIPYLIALKEQLSINAKNKSAADQLLDCAINFFSVFDPVQARYFGETWLDLLEWTLKMLQNLSIPNLHPISAAWLRLDPTAGTFTNFHLRFVRACLDCGMPSQALPILDKNIYAFPTTPAKGIPEDLLSEDLELSNSFITPKSGFTNKVTTEHVLHYYLLGAHVYIGQQNFTRARLFLECVLLTPTQQHVTSALQVEAYKKWVLVGLIAEGKSYSLPRTHDAQVFRSIRSLAKAYDALADDMEKRDWKKYQAEMELGTPIWYEDGNLALVKEAGDALLRYRVLDLQKTYAALPMGRVASHIGFSTDETLQMVTAMTRSGRVNGSISPGATSADAVLRFHGPPVSSSATAMREDDLEAQTKRIEDLVTFVRDADRRLQLTKEYVEVQKRSRRAGPGPDGDMADQMDLTWDQPGGGDDYGDEDIMAA